MKALITSTLGKQRTGQVLVLFTMMLVVILLFAGLALDLGFAYLTKASLSKSVDSACLMGVRNLTQGDQVAQDIARNAFIANYGKSGRDQTAPVPNVQVVVDANNNKTVTVSATSVINTFFLRVIPNFSTLNVSADAAAMRKKVVMSIVLDRSGSMSRNGGSTDLPPAVGKFIDMFNEQQDQVSMTSFSYGATNDVAMSQPFKSKIKNAVNALVFDGWTASEGGLTKGFAQNAAIPADDSLIKVMVFFSDGMANTWLYNFNCGSRNIAQDKTLYDPDTGKSASSGCNIPSTIPSIKGGVVNTSDCAQMNLEAQARAEAVAKQARSQSIIVYAIGMGDPNEAGECGGQFRALNPDFLKDLANTPDSQTYDPTQETGAYAIATNSAALDEVFLTIADRILSRLTK